MNAAQNSFFDIMRNLRNADHDSFLKWIAREWAIEELLNEDKKKEKILADIAVSISERLPFNGILPSESLYEPTNASKEERESTVDIDEFLYDDDRLEELMALKKIRRHKCCACGSRDIEPLTVVSHSCSIERMAYIFRVMLPGLKGKVFLDVGSRYGPVLFGAYFLSAADKIIGIEMNKHHCQIARDVATQYHMLDRVDIINDNLLNQAEAVASADVALVNNAFEYFTSDSVARECWKFLRGHLKSGCYLLMSPAVDDKFSDLLGEPWTNWLDEEPLFQEVLNNTYEDMALYKIKAR